MLRATSVAALALGLAGGAQAQDVSGEVTIWSWNIAAAGLNAVVPSFNAHANGLIFESPLSRWRRRYLR